MSAQRWLITLLVLLLPLAVASATDASKAQTVQVTAMNNGPYSDAKAVQQLPANTSVTLIERQGGWYHVRLDNGQQGWVPMTSIRLGEGSEEPAKSGWQLGSLAGAFSSGRSNTTNAAASTGVRGLNQGTIQNAIPNPQAVEGLVKYAATPAAARSYAAQLKLKSEQVAYLPKDTRGDK